ncbi:MAG: cold shock domain-containing protein [Lachnospiraceae bacterium]|nr:cold shock domain-containing protein [Lachnospiraceae bacterium]
MYGRVTRYFHDRKFGFIRGEDGNTYFIHYTKLNGEYIDSGYYVFFKPFQNDRSDYNARNVMVIEAAERRRKNGNTRK